MFCFKIHLRKDYKHVQIHVVSLALNTSLQTPMTIHNTCLQKKKALKKILSIKANYILYCLVWVS